jgi:hypothetical protein
LLGIDDRDGAVRHVVADADLEPELIVVNN